MNYPFLSVQPHLKLTNYHQRRLKPFCTHLTPDVLLDVYTISAFVNLQVSDLWFAVQDEEENKPSTDLSFARHALGSLKLLRVEFETLSQPP